MRLAGDEFWDSNAAFISELHRQWHLDKWQQDHFTARIMWLLAEIHRETDKEGKKIGEPAPLDKFMIIKGLNSQAPKVMNDVDYQLDAKAKAAEQYAKMKAMTLARRSRMRNG